MSYSNSLGDIYQPSTTTNVFTTELVPVSIPAGDAGRVPGAVKDALGQQFGARPENRAGWGSGAQTGKVWITFYDLPSTPTANRERMLRSAIRSAAAALMSSAAGSLPPQLLLPGDVARSTVSPREQEEQGNSLLTPSFRMTPPMIAAGLLALGLLGAAAYTSTSRRVSR
jgi:hypothetical protein